MIIGTHATLYCGDDISRIENYEQAMNDKDFTWDCHHRAEISDDGSTTSVDELMKNGLYYNRPASELIFLRHDEHARLHSSHMSEERRESIRKASTGRKNPNAIAAMRKASIGRVKTAEELRRNSEAHKGNKYRLGKHHTEEAKRKISMALSGKPGWNKGRKWSEEARKKMSEGQRRRRERERLSAEQHT